MMADYVYLNSEKLADHAQKANAAFTRAGRMADGIGTGLHRWAENMATAANVRLLRAWIGLAPKLDERPSRGDIKEWVKTTLAELDRVDALARELAAERDAAREALAAVAEAHDADVAQLGDERDELRRKLRAAHCERDRARHVECEHGVRVTVRPHGSTSVLLRLPDECLQAETLIVDSWEEDGDGVVTVTAHRQRRGGVASSDNDV